MRSVSVFNSIAARSMRAFKTFDSSKVILIERNTSSRVAGAANSLGDIAARMSSKAPTSVARASKEGNATGALYAPVCEDDGAPCDGVGLEEAHLFDFSTRRVVSHDQSRVLRNVE